MKTTLFSLALVGLTTAYRAPLFPRANTSCSLSQNQTNGGSVLGTLAAPELPLFLNGPLLQNAGVPWGYRNASNCNPYNPPEIPDTGMTRYYEWVIANTTLAPDGVSIPVLVANDQFPGPTIESNWGDWIEVTIVNNLSEGTAIHWHGFLQAGTPYMDGTPGVTQCPIPPGGKFTYRFRAELFGTSWWHGHYSGQYINGLVGPIVVHGPKSASDYDVVDVGPIMLQDWYHGYYLDLIRQVFVATPTGPVLPPMANNMLINGKANYPCNSTKLPCTRNAGLAKFSFQTGKRHLLRLINSGAEALIFFSIDGYKVTVIANDFVPVVPYETDLVVLAVGQRTDILVQGRDDPKEAVWLRITQGLSGLGPEGSTGCSLNDGIAFTTTAGIFYEGADTTIAPNTTSKIDTSRYAFPNACGNTDLAVTVPTFVMPVKNPDVTLNFLMTGTWNATGQFVWYMNNVTYMGDYNDPILLEAKVGTKTFPTARAVYNMGNATSVRIIMNSVGFPASHPMHIHGHNMQVLADGIGTWNGSIVNAQNPQRRDTQLIRPNGYLVVQLDLDNPGVWAFHCHVAWHISEGMNINILSRPVELQNSISIPGTVADTCRDWWSYTDHNVVNVIDSGL